MTYQYKMTLSDDLGELLHSIADERQLSMGEVVARALQLYAASLRGRKEGLAVGLVDVKTLELKREFVGL